MMNNIYDFDSVYEIKARQRRLILLIGALFLCFIAITALFCNLIESNILLTVIFGLLLLAFLVSSTLICKISYRYLSDYASFLDNMETGSREDIAGEFVKKEDAEGDKPFDKYIFLSSGKTEELMIRKENPVGFIKGESYRLECVGYSIYGWEKED